MIITKTTQEARVLKVLQDAEGGWVDGQHFLRTMYLSQYHRAIWNLQHRKERYGYEGVIEASDFTDSFGFKSYRLVKPVPQKVEQSSLFNKDEAHGKPSSIQS